MVSLLFYFFFFLRNFSLKTIHRKANYTDPDQSDLGLRCLPRHFVRELGPVVQSIVSLTNLLRGQLVKCFMTLLPNTHIFFVEKMREAFALQKLLTFFQQKILANSRYFKRLKI